MGTFSRDERCGFNCHATAAGWAHQASAVCFYIIYVCLCVTTGGWCHKLYHRWLERTRSSLSGPGSPGLSLLC